MQLLCRYVHDMPTVLNHNKYTHCNWTNGTCGRVTRLITDPAEPIDDGRGAFRDLRHPPLGCAFMPDNPMWEWDGDSDPFAWSRDEFVLQPVSVRSMLARSCLGLTADVRASGIGQIQMADVEPRGW